MKHLLTAAMILASTVGRGQSDSTCAKIDLRLKMAGNEMRWANEYRTMGLWSIGVGAMFVLADRLNNPDSDWRYSTGCALVSFTGYFSLNVVAGSMDRKAAHLLSGQ